MTGYQRVGDLLVEQGIISEAQRTEALRIQGTSERRIGEIIVSLGFADEAKVAQCLASQYDLKYMSVKEVEPEPEALRLISPTFALSRMILPFHVTQNELHCLIADPLDIQATDYVAKAVNRRLVLRIAGSLELFESISHHYDSNTTSKGNSVKKLPESSPAKPNQISRKTRPVKVQDQADRQLLLGALSGNGVNPIWDFYEVD